MNLTERINFLAKKARTEGLTNQEKEEQALLRKQYIENVRKNMRSMLDNVYIKDENGNEQKIKKK